MIKLLVAVAFLFGTVAAGNFSTETIFTWGDGRGKVLNGGQLVSLSLDNSSGSGFQSIDQFLFGRFDMKIKLVPNNSAGTVATFFMASQGNAHDEIDLEFLGNASGQPYTLHTNVYAKGVGNREQQFRLWFDPTAAFHTYTILWNSRLVMIMVDNIPIRVFNNYESKGVPYPNSQPMNVIASLWDAEDWATQGGRVKTDWSLAPFTAYYMNYNANGCVVTASGNSCAAANSTAGNQAWKTQGLDAKGRNWIRLVQDKYMIYNYCTDAKRFPSGYPKECRLPRF